MSTSWQVSPLTVEQGSIAMGQNDDRPVSIDLVKQLASGETITNSTARLWLLGEGTNAETEYAAGLVGTVTVNGTVVSQRVATLTKGRVYRMVITHGAAGNRRSVEVFIPCVS